MAGFVLSKRQAASAPETGVDVLLGLLKDPFSSQVSYAAKIAFTMVRQSDPGSR